MDVYLLIDQYWLVPERDRYKLRLRALWQIGHLKEISSLIK